MKHLLKLAICSAVLCPLMSSGQSISVLNPDTSQPFYNLVTAMYNDANDLYDSVTFTDFNFTTDALTVPGGTDGDFIAPAAGFTSKGTDFYFSRVASNPPAFTIPSDGYIKIGYFGNENWDLNSLSVKDNTGYEETLFDYDVSGGTGSTVGPPQAATITVASGNTSATVHFMHDNPVKGTNVQSDEKRFHFFKGYDLSGAELPVWVIGIDDRENDLVDFDDGFFYLQVVPEPSQIAMLAVLGLGALLLVRRRFKAKK